MTDSEAKRCDFCLTDVTTYWISEPPEWTTCGQCPGWQTYMRASADAQYRQRMIELLTTLPIPEPWDCCRGDAK